MSSPGSPHVASCWRHWLGWRSVVLALFVCFVGYTSLHHEPWDDECHAFLMARELPLQDLVFKYIAYEGTPPLWHIVLRCLHSAGGNLDALRVLSASIAISSTMLLLWKSPLPTGLNILIPFGFWTSYQYAVVARSYVLLPPLIYLLAACWAERIHRPWRIVGLLALMAGTSAHGFAVAGALAAVFAIELVRNRKGIPARLFQTASFALGSLLLFAGLIYILVRSPADITFKAQNPGLPWLALKNAARSMLDQTWTPFRPLTLLVLAVSTWWFFRTRTLMVWLAPTGTLFLVLWLLWRQEWHLGIVYLVWLGALWISFGNLRNVPPVSKNAILTVTAIFAVGIGSQIAWTIQTAYFDWQLPYSGSHAASQYLRDRHLSSSPLAGVGFPCTAIQAYFPEPLFLNWNQRRTPSTWWWAEQFDYFDSPERLTRAAPAAILRPIKPPIWRSNERYPGYYKAAVFPGYMCFQDMIKEETSFELWLPIENSIQ